MSFSNLGPAHAVRYPIAVTFELPDISSKFHPYFPPVAHHLKCSSDKSYVPYPFNLRYASKVDIPEKDQHVLRLPWFFAGVVRPRFIGLYATLDLYADGRLLLPLFRSVVPSISCGKGITPLYFAVSPFLTSSRYWR